MATRASRMTSSANANELDAYFEGFEDARRIYDATAPAILTLGGVAVRVGKSQIAFRRRRGFAWAWVPARYLHGATAPLVLSIALRRRDPSTRWKEVVEPAPGRFMHHLELHSTEALDAQVLAWLREAWEGGA